MHRRFLHGILLLFVVLATGALARAGIYNTAEEVDIRLDASFDKFRYTLKMVEMIGFPRSAKLDFAPPIRKRYLLWEALAGKSPPRDLTIEDEIDYTAVLLRRKSPDAVPYLELATRHHPDNILLQSHLAQAYWASPGNEARAVDVMNRLLNKRSWPELFQDMNQEQKDELVKLGWSDHPTDFYRRVEGYLLRLMRLRSKEPAGQPFQTVDALFEGGDPPTPIRFVNDQGKFEPGKVSKAELMKLPANARDIVQQLLLWLPEDRRLYWLLGEIYNADGTKEGMIAADRIFDELVFTFNLRAPDLRERRQQMREHVKTFDEKKQVDIGQMEKNLDRNEKKNPPPLLPMTPQTIAVTFASGFVVGLFALWQFQELRRRRRQ
ncbi:MAG TPA: hypothetical protein VHR72_12215 [Gemmataceae bacterium]|nr:hypothetical protein [Gemmataceae bacterium]